MEIGLSVFHHWQIEIFAYIIDADTADLYSYFFPVKIYQCNYDVTYASYEIYTGAVEYSESSIKLIDEGITIFVGKGHEIVPRGNSHGTVVYSTKSHVVVFYVSDNQS